MDSDNDGLPDTYELANNLSTNTPDAHLNADSDHLTNLEEYNAGTDPQVWDAPQIGQGAAPVFALRSRPEVLDSDSDGMPDAWELANGLSTNVNDAAGNDDGDPLSNLEEYNADTDPQVHDALRPPAVASAAITVDSGAYWNGWVADTDSDGMPDWWEARYGLNPATNDATGNLDGDDLTNAAEYEQGYSPIEAGTGMEVFWASAGWVLDTVQLPPDSDGDGMRDWWEALHGLNISSNDASGNLDSDFLSNLEEYNAGTDPRGFDRPGLIHATSAADTLDTGGYAGGYATDTDSDGMPDWWESHYGLSLLTNDAHLNPDEDLLTNLEEYNTGWNPTMRDWYLPVIGESFAFLCDTGGLWTDDDADGMPDWWERRYFGGDTVALDVDDTDHDRARNADEFVMGTDPTNAASVLCVEGVVPATPSTPYAVVTWRSAPGRTYSLHSYTGSFVYASVTTNLLATPPLNTHTDTVTHAGRTFFRITTAR